MHPKEILSKLEASARKSFSQNFLTSPHWAERLAQLATEIKVDEIWEIGPGLGALTKGLVEKAKCPIKVFEIDRKLAEYVRAQFPTVEVIEGDFLDFDAKSAAKGKKLTIVSNLPYHLSSKIIFELAEIRGSIIRMVLTFQKEFAERLEAGPRSKDYAAITIMVQSLFKVDSIGILPAKAFYPAPTVASEALLFEPRSFPEDEAKTLRALLNISFQFRRKKLLGVLKKNYSNDVETPFRELGLSPDCRPEELSVAQFQQLSRKLRKI